MNGDERQAIMLNSKGGFIAGVGVTSALVLATVTTIVAQQQQPPAGGQPAQGRGQRGGGGGPSVQPLNPDDRRGFTPIFDGTMKDWDGDPKLWRADNGMLVGETTEANAIKENSFAIWQGGQPADFELKLDFRMNSTNSGIQFRSERLKPGAEGRGAVTGNWVLKGYQADIDFANQFTGMIYEERGRGFLTQRDEPRQAVHLGPDGSKTVIGHLERKPDELKALVKPGDWNSVHLIARGNTIINIVNGHVMCVIVDDDVKNRASKGLIGFQIHVGPPMKIEFRNIAIKKL
jgi:3-keto-disaccharide hydrolase